MWQLISNFIKPVVDLVTIPLKGINERSKLKIETKMTVAKITAETGLAVAKSQLRLAEKGQQTTANYDMEVLKQKKFTIMDELITIIIWSPVVSIILAGIYEGYKAGTMLTSVTAATTSLGLLPFWLIVLVCGSAASYLGLRYLIEPLLLGKDRVLMAKKFKNVTTT